MSTENAVPTHDKGTSRSVWIVWTLFVALLLLLQLLRVIQSGTLDAMLLFPAALVVMGLSHVFQLKGILQLVVQAVMWALVVFWLILIIR